MLPHPRPYGLRKKSCQAKTSLLFNPQRAGMLGDLLRGTIVVHNNIAQGEKGSGVESGDYESNSTPDPCVVARIGNGGLEPWYPNPKT